MEFVESLPNTVDSTITQDQIMFRASIYIEASTISIIPLNLQAKINDHDELIAFLEATPNQRIEEEKDM
ncbi:15514_t:CDS:2 [Rhizophagus irregularis]|nr:15514_t:CDS:2 [Rhizophagus irregularis]